MSTTTLACRSCGAAPLLPVPARDVLFCPACTLVQTSGQGSGSVLPALRSTSESLLAHARALVAQVILARRLGPDSLVIEAGSNDGWLLRHYRDAGVPVLGIEPDHAAAKTARQSHGIPTREASFSRSVADRLVLQGLQADVLHAHDILQNTPDLPGFVRGIRRVLKPDGIAIIETPCIRNGLADGAQCCFSLTALAHCVAGAGLTILDVEQVTADGAGLRVYVMPDRADCQTTERVRAMLAEEEAWGVRVVETYAGAERQVA